jgi:hypothetical protein
MDWNRISQKGRGVGVKFYDFFRNLDLFSYGKWRGPGAGTVDCDWHSIHDDIAGTHRSLSVWWL